MKKWKVLIAILATGLFALYWNIQAYNMSDSVEDKSDLVNNLFYKLSLNSLISTDNMFWCKNQKLFIEPFPIENYTIQWINQIFHKDTKEGKVFIKYAKKLKNKITLNNQREIQNYITNACNKTISKLDKTKIISLYNELTNYTNLYNKTFNKYIDIYNDIKNKNRLWLREDLNNFKKLYDTAYKEKVKINKLSVLEVNIKDIQYTMDKDNYVNLNIIPEDNKVIINWEYYKLNYFNLIVNKKHFNDFQKIKNIIKIYLLWVITNKNWITINNIENLIYK